MSRSLSFSSSLMQTCVLFKNHFTKHNLLLLLLLFFEQQTFLSESDVSQTSENKILNFEICQNLNVIFPQTL